jgi:hypothetical protein
LNTVTIVLAVLVGALIDLGIYRLMVYSRRPSIRDSRSRRITWRLLGLMGLWVIVPLGEYFACSTASASAGFTSATAFFVAGFVLISAFGNRNQFLHDLRKLDAKDRSAADWADGKLQ